MTSDDGIDDRHEEHIPELDEDTLAAWAWEKLQHDNPGKTEEELKELLLDDIRVAARFGVDEAAMWLFERGVVW